MERIGVTLLSGGLDSTTVTALAKDKVENLTALTFYYGQTHGKELDCAREVARLLGVGHELVDIGGFRQVAWYSSLTNPDRFPLPKDRTIGEIGSFSGGTGGGTGADVPLSYVPLRNTFFLAMAAAYLESVVLHAIEVQHVARQEVEAYIYLAPNSLDYSGYPDCRPEYYEKMAEALIYGSKLWTQYKVPFQIETPIIHLSKAEIVKLGMKLKAPLEHTWSCYEGGELPCARCDSCVLRAKGFAEAGHRDPLLVRLVETP